MDAAHQDAVARAKAIAARLAGMEGLAYVDLSAHKGDNGTSTATSVYGSAAAPAGGNDVNCQAMAALDAAFAMGGGGATSAPASTSYSHASAAPALSSDENKKRGVEDVLASLIPGLGHVSANMNDPTKRLRTDDNKTVKKLWIPSDRNPGYNYVGLLIGPAGSKQRELVAQSGGDVKISIRGKGSSSKMDNVPGMPEEPLHVLLEGSAECVSKAEALVRELLEDSEAADKEKARQLSIVNTANDIDGSNGNAGAATSYTPKPVAQILGLNATGTAGTMAGSTALSAYGPGPGEEQVEEKIGVPNGIVGFIIGRGGESITSMQRRTGCRVQIQKEHEMAPGTTQRVITLTASTAEGVAQCRAIIESMVKERLQAAGSSAVPSFSAFPTAHLGPGSNAAAQMAQLQKALEEGQSHVTIQVPDADVGLIIGKGGAQIRNIQEKSGANVQIPQVADVGNPLVRTVNITHPNMEGATFAKQMIEEILSTKVQSASGGGFAGSQDVTIQVNCPDKDVGMIIGRGGCVIKQIQSSTRCRIQIPPTAPPGSIYRVISVIGNAAGCMQVKQMIETIVAEQSSQSVMSGVAFANSGSQYGQQQPYGQLNYYGQQQIYGQQQQVMSYGQQVQQPDYSAEWAAYYAAQAAAQGGAVNTTTGTAPLAAAAATNVSTTAEQQPAHDAYYEVFWQYAAYYGEEAARKHYGAWSPPVGTPNPNAATNIGNAAASVTSDTSNIPATDVKDSSVRKVSNLPAWMNNG